MSSVICQNFVQNAWRKDLCSNCFKSKEEHDSDAETPNGVTNRYLSTVTTVYQTHNYYGHHSWKNFMAQDKGMLKAPSLLRSLTSLNSVISNNNNCDSVPNQNHSDIREEDVEVRSDPGVNMVNHVLVNGDGSELKKLRHMVSETKLLSAILTDEVHGKSESVADTRAVGILRTARSIVKKRTGISFGDLVPQVIGFGGDVSYSSDEYDNDSDSDGSIRTVDLTEEEVGLKYLTEKNTNYNSMASNLLSPVKLSSIQEVPPTLPSKVTSVSVTKEGPKVPIKPFPLTFNYAGVKVNPVAPFMKSSDPIVAPVNEVTMKEGSKMKFNNGPQSILNDLPALTGELDSWKGIKDDGEIPEMEEVEKKGSNSPPLPPLIHPDQEGKDVADLKELNTPQLPEEIIISVDDISPSIPRCPSTTDSEISDRAPELPSTPPPSTSLVADNCALMSTFCSPRSSFLHNGQPKSPEEKISSPNFVLNGTETQTYAVPNVKTANSISSGSSSGASTPNVYGAPSSPKFATINGSKSSNKPPLIKPKPKVPVRPSNRGTRDNLVSSSESIPPTPLNGVESHSRNPSSENGSTRKTSQESDKADSNSLKSSPPISPMSEPEPQFELNKDYVPPPPSVATSEFMIVHPKPSHYKIQRNEKALSSYGDYQFTKKGDKIPISGPDVHRTLLHTISYEPESFESDPSHPRSQSLTRLVSDLPREVDLGSRGSYNPCTTPPELRRKPANERGRDRSKKRTSKLKSLKKFLKLGNKDSEDKNNSESEYKKPKPEIIHPLDFNKNGVEVIRTKPIQNGISGENENLKSPVSPYAYVDLSHATFKKEEVKAPEAVKMSLGTNSAGKVKPPPPPRGKSLEESKKMDANPPARPPPPRSDLLRKSGDNCSSTSSSPPCSPVRNDYANLGDIRSTMVPKKPERSSSLRDVFRDDPIKRRAPQPPLTIAGISMSDSETGEQSPSSLPRWKTSRLSMRHGRTVVHKNLEENYGAVISANHEALAQILEQVLTQRTASYVEELKCASDLRWTDLKVLDNSCLASLGWWKFFEAIYKEHMVTVMVTSEPLDMGSTHKSSFSCIPVVSFKDIVPFNVTPLKSPSEGDVGQATITIFPEMSIQTIPEFCESLESVMSTEFPRQACFMLLQLVHSLKALQAQGVEEVNDSLDNFVLAVEDNSGQQRLLLLCEHVNSSELSRHAGNSTGKLSLCQCALVVLFYVLKIPNPMQKVRLGHELNLPEDTPLFTAYVTIADLLQQEKAVSLTKVKSLLEYVMWGPDDLNLDIKEAEQGLQRWLDLERATVLNNIVKTQGLWSIQLTVLEEYHLLFLVRATAKTLRESSLLLLADNTNF